MATIEFPDPEKVSGKLDRIFTTIRRREEKVFGVSRISNVWLAQAHDPEYLRCNWERSRAVMQRGNVSPETKELVASSISIINHCRY